MVFDLLAALREYATSDETKYAIRDICLDRDIAVPNFRILGAVIDGLIDIETVD
jgi:hypothetical protein